MGDYGLDHEVFGFGPVGRLLAVARVELGRVEEAGGGACPALPRVDHDHLAEERRVDDVVLNAVQRGPADVIFFILCFDRHYPNFYTLLGLVDIAATEEVWYVLDEGRLAWYASASFQGYAASPTTIVMDRLCRIQSQLKDFLLQQRGSLNMMTMVVLVVMAHNCRPFCHKAELFPAASWKLNFQRTALKHDCRAIELVF